MCTCSGVYRVYKVCTCVITHRWVFVEVVALKPISHLPKSAQCVFLLCLFETKRLLRLTTLLKERGKEREEGREEKKTNM